MVLNSLTLKRKILAIFILLVLFPVIFTAGLLYIQAMNGMNRMLDDEMTRMVTAANYFYNNKMATALQIAKHYSEQDNLASALKNKNRTLLAALSAPIYKELSEINSISIFEFGDASGKVICRAHNPDLYGDDKSSNESVAGAINGFELKGFELGKSGLAIRAFVPIKADGKIIGTLQVGYNINEHLLSELQPIIAGDISFYNENTLILTTQDTSLNILHGKITQKDIFQKVLKGGKSLKILDGNENLEVYFPLYSPYGTKLQGMMSVTRSISALHGFTLHVITISAVILLIFVSISVMISIWLSYRIHNEIRYLSFHDKLTGLFNRAFMEEELEHLDTPKHYPLSIVIGDVNGLKPTNDIFGHHTGDHLLMQVAAILQGKIRKDDILARWGGDEFVVLMPRTDEKTATELCNDVIRTCDMAEDGPAKPSISMGSAIKSRPEQEIKSVMNEAGDRMYRRKLLEKKSSRSLLISSLEKTLYERNCETQEHTQRLCLICKAIGPAFGLSDSEQDEIELLAKLHDIGKVGIKDNILMKPGKLSPQEWEEMKKHSEIGYRIAESCKELSHIAEYILHHHEKWDGSGYPLALKGEEIPRLSTIISVADAYDAMTNARPYRKKVMNHEEALEEIIKCRGTQFSPHAVDIFVSIMSEGISNK